MNWLILEAVYAIHYIELAERGGAPGVRDAGLIESALARAQNKAAYGNPSIDDLAAAYLYGFAKNHGFVDGNKRIAFLAADIFLRRNGYEIHATQPEIIAFVLSVASGEVDEELASRWIRYMPLDPKTRRRPHVRFTDCGCSLHRRGTIWTLAAGLLKPTSAFCLRLPARAGERYGPLSLTPASVFIEQLFAFVRHTFAVRPQESSVWDTCLKDLSRNPMPSSR